MSAGPPWPGASGGQQPWQPPPWQPPPWQQAKPRSNAGRRVAVALGAVALIVIVAVFAAFVFMRHDPDIVTTNGTNPPTQVAPRPQTTGPVPFLYVDTKSSPAYAGLDDRATDPNPFTLGEIFAEDSATPSYKGFELSLKDKRIDTDCRAGVWGEGLKSKLVDGGCSQLMRGYFLDQTGRYVAQVAAFNMASVTGANDVVAALEPDDKAGFLLPLAADPPYDRLMRGASKAYGTALGHFVIFSWVARTDGASPGAADNLIALSVTAEDFKDFVDRRRSG